MNDFKFGKVVFTFTLLIYLGLLTLTSMMAWMNVRYFGDGELMWSGRNIYFYKAASFAATNFPKGTRIAATHIGTVQYFSGMVVVDAGGKVDYSLSDATKQGKLYEALVNKNVSYMIHFITQSDFNKIDKKDLVYSDTVYRKPNEPLAYLNNLQTGEIEGYLVILKLKREYVNFFLPHSL